MQFRSYYLDPRRGEALHMGLSTLLKMAQGGIRDHIGAPDPAGPLMCHTQPATHPSGVLWR